MYIYKLKSVCPFCSGRFSTKSSLKRHIGSQHKVEWSQSRSAPADTSTNVAPVGASAPLEVVEVPEPEVATVRQVCAEEGVSSGMREVRVTSNSVAVRLPEDENPDDIPELISREAMADFELCLPPELYGPMKCLTESLADFMPSYEERVVFEQRMSLWERRVVEAIGVIDEDDWVAKFRRTDPELGYMGIQTLRFMLRCRQGVSTKKARLVVPAHRGLRVPVPKFCTIDPRRSSKRRNWQLPSSTVTAPPPSDVESSAVGAEGMNASVSKEDDAVSVPEVICVSKELDQPDPVPESESSLTDQATMRFCALSASGAANEDPFLPAADVSFELAVVELAGCEENVTGLDDEFSFDLLEMVNACDLEL